MSDQKDIMEENLTEEKTSNVTRDFTSGYDKLYSKAKEEQKEKEAKAKQEAQLVYQTQVVSASEVEAEVEAERVNQEEPADGNIEKYDFHEVRREKKKRKKKNYLVRLGILAGVAVIVVLFLMSSVFDVKEIDVEGNSYYSDEEVIAMAGVEKGDNLFFNVKKSDVVQRLTENPYYTEVKVKKSIPSKVIINVKERHQIAALRYGEEYIILDRDAVVLRRSDVNPKLTILKGFKITGMDVGEEVGVEETQTLKNALAVVVAANRGDFYFKSIDCSRVIFKAYVYDTLPVKGTAKKMKDSLDSGDLQKVVNKLIKDGTKRGTINIGNGNYVSFSPDFS